MNISEEIQTDLKSLADFFDQEDKAVRERQVRTWRKLKLYWEGFQRVYYDDIAHDWRVWDASLTQSSDDSVYYDKPVNIFRAYLESIIAALSISIPAILCIPDDAEDNLDCQTAKSGDKIARLIYRHNDVPLLWIQALYTLVTEGMIACYNYTDTNEEYGYVDKPKEEDTEEEHHVCVNCKSIIDEIYDQTESLNDRERDEFDPGDDDVDLAAKLKEGPVCPYCQSELDPELQKSKIIITRITGTTKEPKSRQCLQILGGLYVKVPNYARRQCDIPYLRWSYETHYTFAIDKYEELRDNLSESARLKTGYDGGQEYDRWGRMSPQYRGEWPLNTVTWRHYWFRPESYNYLAKDRAAALKKKFPDGCHAVFINDLFAEACNECLDDHWTLTFDPLSDYLHHQPMGELLVNIQDITNDLIALTVQTIEQGIISTFADPNVVDFDAYRQSEASPGSLYPLKPQPANKNISEAFFPLKPATLGQEVLPFGEKIQTMGQLAVGALPSIFGGMAEAGSKTASEYSMSRAQALQRLQTHWKMLTYWWKQIFAKVIPQYMKDMIEDERFVTRNKIGAFENILIRKADTEGTIGSIELAPDENLPVTPAQKKDVFMQLMQFANPQLIGILSAPENIPFIREVLGIPELAIPGDVDREKQNEEISQLINSVPLSDSQSSVPVDPILDNHQIEAEICRHFLVGEEGRELKIDNPEAYLNVLLHMKEHMMFATQGLMGPQGQPPSPNGEDKSKTTPPDSEAPIQGEEDAVTPIH